MPLVLTPKSEPAQLRRRLASLRDRWRGRVTLQFVGATAGGLAAFFLLVGLTDIALQLPALLRAGALVSALVGLYWLWRFRFVQSLSDLGNDLAVAWRVEKRFPEFNDALASAVQFSELDAGGSPALRTATERRAMRGAAECELESLLPGRGPVLALGAAAVLAIIAAGLVAAAPETCGVATLRILDPFGDHPWPPATRLTVHAPARLARGEPFLLHGELHGVVPDRVEFRFAADGAVPTSLALAVSPADDFGTFAVRLEPNRIPRSFRYQVAANDAVTPWATVPVLRPPELAPLNGRPSPQIHVEYPRYTQLPPADLVDGGGAVEAVVGSTVTIRAAVDRPVQAAALELADDNPVRFAAAIAPIGMDDPWLLATGMAAAITISGAAPARVESDGMQFELTSIPLLSGRYQLRFVDADELAGRRPLEIRVTPDPSPAVQLERPAAGRESLAVLPDATMELLARIEDPVFAIRSVWLEYRVAADGVSRRLPLRDLRSNPAAAASVGQRLELKSLPLDRPLRDGDLLVLAVAADDFDDVTPTKPPGRSHEVELHIVGQAGLAAILQKSQSEIQKELSALHQLQRQARELAEAADAGRRATGQLTNEDRERLSQANQLQQQVRQRTGDGKDGLRSTVDQLRQTLRNNPTPGSQPERDRADAVAAELERLSQESLAAIEPLLAAGRGERETAPPERRTTGPLPDAVRKQRDAERSLRELAERMGAWSEARELKAEAGLVERELERLARQREEIERQPGVRGARPSELTSEQRAELARLAEQQNALADRANELAQRLAQRAAEKQAQAVKAVADDGSTVEARDAAEQAQREAAALAKARDRAHGPPSVAADMQSAAKSMTANQHGEAAAQQQAAAQALKDVQSALSEATEPNVDRLSKRLKDAEDAVEKLLDDQERLQKQSNDARALTNDAERRSALQRSAQDQDQLREKVEEMAQRLSRWNQESAARELRRAARAMERAREQIENGEPADERQDDALDRLDDASRELADARQRLDGELQRERQGRLIERLRGFLRRQTELAAESERLFQAAKTSAGWTRTLQKSLIDLAQSERSLGEEVTRFADGSWRESRVVVHWLTDAARSMTESAAAIDAVRAGAMDMDTWDDDRRGIQAQQTAAGQRLKQLIDAMREAETARSERPQQNPPDAPTAGAGAGNSDFLPPELQWKLLRTLQAELNERTDRFAREHPDPAKWTAADRSAVQALQQAQAELSRLLESLSAAEPPPTEPKEGRK